MCARSRQEHPRQQQLMAHPWPLRRGPHARGLHSHSGRLASQMHPPPAHGLHSALLRVWMLPEVPVRAPCAPAVARDLPVLQALPPQWLPSVLRSSRTPMLFLSVKRKLKHLKSNFTRSIASRRRKKISWLQHRSFRQSMSATLKKAKKDILST